MLKLLHYKVNLMKNIFVVAKPLLKYELYKNKIIEYKNNCTSEYSK